KRSHLLDFLCFPKESYGYNNGKWGFLLSHPVKNPRHDIAAVSHQFQVLNQLGIEYKDSYGLELWPTAKDRKAVKTLCDSEWLGNARNIIGINLAASEKWETKNWPIEYIAKLCDMLAGQNIRVVITGMEKDRALSQKLLSLAQSKPAVVIGKTTILELAVLIKMCKVFITPDSSPMHIAASMGVPFIVFFGPTDSRRHLPPAKKYHVFERKLECAPCYSTRCKIMTHVCMKEIKVEDVFNKTLELMKIKS
ncbi:MAG: ADP-heptose:LPS heptosyltransferase, partial [Candidatus Omnitrophota bacterium]